ncbi:MAG: SUMF1/EgtB/PvdO family nonheme iron enzyme [Planctomycetales bacterium]|nr:SUMF1/EgtB/PvdO family nonheme iron enzyme [Planctomycetales bacterium]
MSEPPTHSGKESTGYQPDLSSSEQPTLPPRAAASASPGDQRTRSANALLPPTDNGRLLHHVKLGEGGMGVVWKAWDVKLLRFVALKRVLPMHARDAEFSRRFLQEARAVAALDHPNIVRILHLGGDEQGEFIEMEFVEGETLQQRLDRSGPGPWEDAARLVVEVSRGLAAAHDRGIVHRDVKPSNILLSTQGVPKLVDFGLARPLTENRHTLSGQVLGSDGYMAPEQAADARNATGASDQYSIAATLYQMVTGQAPRKLDFRRVPALLVDVLARALEDQPGDRYASLNDWVAALEAAIDRGTTAARFAANILGSNATGSARNAGTPSAPHPLLAPFSTSRARDAQAAWAAHWGRPPELTNMLGMRLRLVPPAEFLLGNDESRKEVQRDEPNGTTLSSDDDYPRHRVRLTRPFYAATTPVTVEQFHRFVTATGYQTEAERDGKGGWGWNPQATTYEGPRLEFNWKATGRRSSKQHSVVNVSWNDANAMVQWLNDSMREWTDLRYRLPSEAEWDHLNAYSNDAQHYMKVAPEALLGERNNLWESFSFPDGVVRDREDVHPFAVPDSMFGTNVWDIHASGGSVLEWCQDGHDSGYYRDCENLVLVDPVGPTSGSAVICRGGAWNQSVLFRGLMVRSALHGSYRCVNVGFRVVLS